MRWYKLTVRRGAAWIGLSHAFTVIVLCLALSFMSACVLFLRRSNILLVRKSCYSTKPAALPSSNPQVKKPCAHQNKIKSNGVHFHPVCEVYKPKLSRFAAFHFSPFSPEFFFSFLNWSLSDRNIVVWFSLTGDHQQRTSQQKHSFKVLIISLLFYASSSLFCPATLCVFNKSLTG